MHLFVILLSASLVMLAGQVALQAGQRLHNWRERRDVQLLVLTAPLASLAVAIGGAHHFAGQICFLGAPPVDYVLSLALPSAMGLVAVAAMALGIVRLVVMRRTWGLRGNAASPQVQALVTDLAQRLELGAPRIAVCDDRRPVALTFGVFHPTLLISRWMLEYLDQAELEAVLAHELAHVARRDYLVAWLATSLRDAFAYLPTSWAAHRQLQWEKELACDDLAVRVTGKPLALASALATVQLRGAPSLPLGAQALAGPGAVMEARVARLLGPASPPNVESARSLVPAGAGILALLGIVGIEVINAATFLASLGCTHGLGLGQFL